MPSLRYFLVGVHPILYFLYSLRMIGPSVVSLAKRIQAGALVSDEGNNIRETPAVRARHKAAPLPNAPFKPRPTRERPAIHGSLKRPLP
jgi:hypothetical protein